MALIIVALGMVTGSAGSTQPSIPPV